jgi:hypothetical protein
MEAVRGAWQLEEALARCRNEEFKDVIRGPSPWTWGERYSGIQSKRPDWNPSTFKWTRGMGRTWVVVSEARVIVGQWAPYLSERLDCFHTWVLLKGSNSLFYCCAH